VIQTIETASVTGLDVHPVRVEVSITRGTPMIQIVGLAQSAVHEGRERIRAAAAQLGLHVPGLRITVNLAPADRPKQGSGFDLPIVLGILAAAGELPSERLVGTLIAGELGLDGTVRPIRGVLPVALHAARTSTIRRLIVPYDNLREAAAGGVPALGARSLGEVVAYLGGGDLASAADLPPRPAREGERAAVDLSTVLGQSTAKRALEIAAAGEHNLLFIGAPGSGKTSLARCLPGLLVPLSTEEAVEVTAIHSVAGVLPAEAGLVRERPFRAPHHTISEAGLIGGGGIPRPGEASLAHAGVLFLDELPEFGRRPLEALRQPMEDGTVHLVRARASASFPARFTLVAAMNPCPCGYLGVPERPCRCGDGAIASYRRRVSGPLLDRIDLRVEVPPLTWGELSGGSANGGEASAVVRDRVREARARAARRGAGGARLEDVCRLDDPGRGLLRVAVERLGLSARGVTRALRIARTIADLAAADRVAEDHVAEAIRYRGAELTAPI